MHVGKHAEVWGHLVPNCVLLQFLFFSQVLDCLGVLPVIPLVVELLPTYQAKDMVARHLRVVSVNMVTQEAFCGVSLRWAIRAAQFFVIC